MIGIGTHEAVLWGVLPVAVLLAAYAPRAISFAAGQAGFTVVLFVLFNIIQPVGWRSLASLGRMADGDTRLERCGENLDREIHALQWWYVTLGHALVNDRPVPPPHIRDAEGRSRLVACVRDAARGRDEATVRAALVLLWASQHLDNLWRLEAHLGERARAASAASTDAGALRMPGFLRGR